MNTDTPAHFKGKDAIGHVAEAHAEGIILAAEIHGLELPGHLFAGADAFRETGVIFLLVWTLFTTIGLPSVQIFQLLLLLGIGWSFWKTGRSAWLGWARLERLHRVLDQERWEISHHRQQERDELRVLYAAKGLEGKLLEDVLDVLMADDNRLLQIMIEEELGLALESQEHPLKQSMGALIGTLLGAGLSLLGLFLEPHWGLPVTALCTIGIGAAVAARYTQNRLIPATIWMIGLGLLAFGSIYFLTAYLI
jgi:hypothetical protein